MNLTPPEPLKSITRQREFVEPSMNFVDHNGWLRLKDSKSGNEVNFNLLHYGYTVLVWERTDGEDRS